MPHQSQRSLNTIFFGPPGTGKTYRTYTEAVEICEGAGRTEQARMSERFRELRQHNRIETVTFHQSYSYEDFIEGLRPILAKADPKGTAHTIKYEVRPGILKSICSRASASLSSSIWSAYNLSEVRCWKISLGKSHPSSDDIPGKCFTNNWLLLGHGKGLDFSDCDDNESVTAVVEAADSSIGDPQTNINAIDRFKNKVKVGDLIIVSQSPRTFRAVGRVKGEYSFRADRDNYTQMRPVEWLRIWPNDVARQQVMKGDFLEGATNTIYELNRVHINYDFLSEIISSKKPRSSLNFVLVIDEINRGNISKILGESITLFEPDKRIGARNELRIRLPYSGEEFGVPANLYIIGTMNTADRSIAFLDIALRRRFSFVEVPSQPSVLRNILPNHADLNNVDVCQILEIINKRIELLIDRDHVIGHAYFLEVKTLTGLRDVFMQNVIPLLQEYLYGDWPKICAILGCSYSRAARTANKKPLISAEQLSIDLLGGTDVDELMGIEEKLRFAVNKKFVEAQESELSGFFIGIINIAREKNRTVEEPFEADEDNS